MYIVERVGKFGVGEGFGEYVKFKMFRIILVGILISRLFQQFGLYMMMVKFRIQIGVKILEVIDQRKKEIIFSID